MSMSDCEKCWDTPCTCGWDYRKYKIAERISLAAVVLGISRRTVEKRLGHFIPTKHPGKSIK